MPKPGKPTPYVVELSRRCYRVLDENDLNPRKFVDIAQQKGFPKWDDTTIYKKFKAQTRTGPDAEMLAALNEITNVTFESLLDHKNYNKPFYSTASRVDMREEIESIVNEAERDIMLVIYRRLQQFNPTLLKNFLNSAFVQVDNLFSEVRAIFVARNVLRETGADSNGADADGEDGDPKPKD